MTGQNFGDVYRTVTLDTLIDTLLLEGFAYEDDWDAARAEAREAIDRWVASGLPVRSGPDGPLFDPVEAECHAERAGRRGEDDFWEARFVTTLRRFVTDLERQAPERITVTYERLVNLSGCAEGETKRLRMPLPLAARYSALNIVSETPPETVAHRASDGRLEVRVTAHGKPVRIAARCDIELGPGNAEAPPQGDLYLRPKEGLVVITSEVEALARRLGGRESALTAIRNFWDYILDNFAFCPVHYDQVPSDAPLDWVLRTGVYDCQLASALFVALCRTAGIPARLVSGNFLYRRSPTNHFWAEVWLETSGWTPFDFLVWDLSCAGRVEEWRYHFFGRIEPRLIMECLPASFTGTVGVPVPAQWHILRTIEGHGAAIELVGLEGQLVYRDTISIG